MRVQSMVTRIQVDTTFRQRRQLPRGLTGTVTAHSGQEVTRVQIVARAERPAGFFVLEAVQEYGFPARDLNKCLLVQPGLAVRPGTPLLEKKRRFRKSRIVESPVEGTIEDIYDGRLLIRRKPLEKDIRSLLNGFVVFTIQNRGVSIETKATRIEGLASSQEEGFGQFKLLCDLPTGMADPEEILEEVQGSIVGLGFIDDLALVQQAVKRGARGFIAGSVSGEIYTALQKIRAPFIITDGIGRQGMTEPIFEALGLAQGQEISLLTDTHSHSVRPLIIIPARAGGSKPAPEGDLALAPGQKVRLLRAPYQSVVGEVIAIYSYAREKTYFGAHVPSADVLLPSGDVITVPCANLDIIM